MVNRVKYKNKTYIVMPIKYKDTELPIVMDLQDYNAIKGTDKSWKSNKYGFISCSHTYNNEVKEVFMHDIIMALKQKGGGLKMENRPIVHINRIGLDNRRENLLYDVVNKDHNKNLKKKKRTITLPVSSGIKPEEIPTYVWYMQPNGSHGDRFMVEIGNIKWKTTSSKKFSLRYKLEEAKLFLRQLKTSTPDLFQDHSMNGDFTKEGKVLMDSYYDIIHAAGYNHISRFVPKEMTKEYLKPGKTDRKEKKILNAQGSLMPTGNKKRRVASNLPKDCDLTMDDLPTYCYYRPIYKNRGDYFIVEGHPKQQKKVWATTSMKSVSIEEKYEELMDHLDELENGVNSEDTDTSESE